MAWTDYFMNSIAGVKVGLTPLAEPFITTEIVKDEFVEIHLTHNPSELPFCVLFRSAEETRVYGYVGTREIACKLAMDVVQLRLNSEALVLTDY